MVKDFFWTDAVQAAERLVRSHVMYGENVAYVENVANAEKSGQAPIATIVLYPKGERQYKELSDEAFHKFRRLPPLGWVNTKRNKSGIFLARKPARTRTHGLCDTNVSVGSIQQGSKFQWSEQHFSQIAGDEGYTWSITGTFPLMADVLNHIRPGQTFAISSNYAIARDEGGVRWFYREHQRVGLFPGNDTLLLIDKFKFLREELTEDPLITISNIKDF